MALGTALSVVQTLFAALQCSELKEICSIFGYESQLSELNRTVNTVKAVFLDTENHQELNNEAQLYIKELKGAIYDADDLLDKFVTLTKQKQLIKKGGKVSKKVRRFFSRYNPLGVAYKMSQVVKEIRKNLDAITKNHDQFSFKVNSEPTRWRREETCSYVYEGNIIGREDDVEKIVGYMLNDVQHNSNVSFLTIVGIGGLGKTALAQLIFNDVRVTTAFSLRSWICVSDHDQNPLDVDGILRKILASIGEKDEERTKDLLQKKLREKLRGNKYFLVLDDVWTESRNQWFHLVEFLLGSQRGSWIVVTTRSNQTAKIIGGGPTHDLQGLSKENSWCLFKRIAFGSEHLTPRDDLIEIGREIVEGCARVPLAIKVAGSMLYGQDKSKWQLFQKIGLSNFRESQYDIMPILKLSYHQLESHLKSCFTYCAVFPKDFVIKKEMLISLWMAQDYIVPLNDGQRVEDAAEEYFTILLRRCFFHDVEYDVYGEIISCKIHDLMHDIAQQIAGKEICITSSESAIVDMVENLRHVAHGKSHPTQCFYSKTHIRSFLNVGGWNYLFGMDQSSLEALLANWMCLRVLDLSGTTIESLPHSIDKLLHLRYLDLSENSRLEVLPKSITKLYNLQTLRLRECYYLKELPKDLMKLVNLRNLDIINCGSLTNMPPGMSKLTCLERLSRFVVKDEPNSCGKELFDQLGELKQLESLKGKLHVEITFCENGRQVKEVGRRERAYLKSKEHLNHIRIVFRGTEYDEVLMEELQPHPNLKVLELLSCLNKKEMPSWLTSLPFLKRLTLLKCGMENLTCLGNLPQLEFLYVEECTILEYMIEKSAFPLAGRSEPMTWAPNGIFPCLRELKLMRLYELKGWRYSGEGLRLGNNDQQLHIDVDTISTTTSSMVPLALPQLKSLKIFDCPNLKCTLLCPNLEHLHLEFFNKELQIITGSPYLLGDEKAEGTSSSTFSYNGVPKLRDIAIDDVAWLSSLPTEAFQCLVKLRIRFDKKVKSLGEAGVVFSGCSSSLKSLGIEVCSELRSVLRGGLEHLTALEDLSIWECRNLSSLGEGEEEERVGDIGMPWPSLLPSLRNLTFIMVPLVNLPYWMQSLTTLQSLRMLRSCWMLESLPNWVTSIRELQLG